jgi:hypothetical protein
MVVTYSHPWRYTGAGRINTILMTMVIYNWSRFDQAHCMLIITTPKLCVEEHTAMNDWLGSIGNSICKAYHDSTAHLSYDVGLICFEDAKLNSGVTHSHPSIKGLFYCLAKCSVQVTHMYLFELGGGSCMNLFLSNLWRKINSWIA